MAAPGVPFKPAYNPAYHIPFDQTINLTERVNSGLGYRKFDPPNVCPKCGEEAHYQDFSVDPHLHSFPAGMVGRSRVSLYLCYLCQENYVVIEEPR